VRGDTDETLVGVAGAGRVSWIGNNKVGAGRMEIVGKTAPDRVEIKLDFLRPMVGHDTIDFTLRPHGNVTDVTWSLRGRNSFTAKVLHLFMNMDRMIGGDYENGLANLKVIAES